MSKKDITGELRGTSNSQCQRERRLAEKSAYLMQRALPKIGELATRTTYCIS